MATSVSARRSWLLVAVGVLACRDRKQLSPRDADLEVRAAGDRVLFDARSARRERISTLRPTTSLDNCKPVPLATLVQIAGGAYRWNDAIERPRPDEAAFAARLDLEVREAMWDDALRAELFQCLNPGRGEAARRLRLDLDPKLAHEPTRSALGQMLTGPPAARKAALQALALAPSSALRDIVVSGGSDDDEVRRALVAIDDLPIAFAMPAAWASWIEAHRVATGGDATLSLLATAAGTRDGAAPPKPASETWLLVRRAAAQAARERIAMSADATPPQVLASALALSHDPDAKIRRDAVSILITARSQFAERLAELARSDPEPAIRLIAR